MEKPEVHVTDEDTQFVLDNINKRLELDNPLGETYHRYPLRGQTSQ